MCFHDARQQDKKSNLDAWSPFSLRPNPLFFYDASAMDISAGMVKISVTATPHRSLRRRDACFCWLRRPLPRVESPPRKQHSSPLPCPLQLTMLRPGSTPSLGLGNSESCCCMLSTLSRSLAPGMTLFQNRPRLIGQAMVGATDCRRAESGSIASAASIPSIPSERIKCLNSTRSCIQSTCWLASHQQKRHGPWLRSPIDPFCAHHADKT